MKAILQNLKFIFKQAGKYSIIGIVIKLMGQLLPIAEIYVSAAVIDGAVRVIRGAETWDAVIVPAILLCGLVLAAQVEDAFWGLNQIRLKRKVNETYIPSLISHFSNLEYHYIENAEVNNLYNRVREDAENSVINGCESIGKILSTAIRFIGTLLIIARYSLWSGVLFIVILCFVVQLAIMNGKKQYDVKKEYTQYVRSSEYFETLLMDREHLGERNLFETEKFVQSKWLSFFSKAKKEERKTAIIGIIRMKLVSSGVVLIASIVAAGLMYSLIEGRISVGLCISIIQSVAGLIGIISWDVSDALMSYEQFSEYVKEVNGFFLLRENGHTESGKGICEGKLEIYKIEFSKVSFRYPDTEADVLKDVSFIMNAGKKYALVGANGSGKSTIVKLLLGLYTNYTGKILVNDININEYSAKEREKMFSVIFQDFTRYPLSVKENITIGNLDETNPEEKCEKVIQSCEMEEMVQSLKHGKETVLTKLQEEGTDLSGGEWQKIAMARLKFNPGTVAILDEPTAALDPMSESKVYKEYSKMTEKNMMLMITHRMGSIRTMDYVLVLEEGKIVEEGNPLKLEEQKGLFANMYNAQKEWYMS